MGDASSPRLPAALHERFGEPREVRQSITDYSGQPAASASQHLFIPGERRACSYCLSAAASSAKFAETRCHCAQRRSNSTNDARGRGARGRRQRLRGPRARRRICLNQKHGAYLILTKIRKHPPPTPINQQCGLARCATLKWYGEGITVMLRTFRKVL